MERRRIEEEEDAIATSLSQPRLETSRAAEAAVPGNDSMGSNNETRVSRSSRKTRRQRRGKKGITDSDKSVHLAPASHAQEQMEAGLTFAPGDAPTARQRRQLLLVAEDSSCGGDSSNSSIAYMPGAFRFGGEGPSDCDGTVQYSAVLEREAIGLTPTTDNKPEIDERNGDTLDRSEKLVVAELAPETVVGTAIPWHTSGGWRRVAVVLFLIAVICVVVLVSVLVSRDNSGSPLIRSSAPTEVPTLLPTTSPTATQIAASTNSPTQNPTTTPSLPPTAVPTTTHSQVPTMGPTSPPSHAPTMAPTTAVQHVETIISDFFGSRPSSVTQQQALEWLLGEEANLSLTQTPDILFERFLLAIFYFSLNGRDWASNTGWLSESSACGWEGVLCHLDGRVSEIFLNSNNLVGKIPLELGLFPALATLSLSSNAVTGSLPTELGDMTSLQFLGLLGTDLTGTIPTELGKLSAATSLGLSANALSGTIPTELGSLTNLSILFLSINRLTGTLPSELGQLTSMTFFAAEENNLSGSVPAEIENLSSSLRCHLAGNGNMVQTSNRCVFT